MIVPRRLGPIVDSLAAIVEGWPVTIGVDDVVRWILQFEPDDYELASRIVSNLNVLGAADIRAGLRAAYSRLERKAVERHTPISHDNTLFAGIGEMGKSGAAMAYEFRLANSLPEGNFDSDAYDLLIATQRVKNIVLIDDVIGSGATAAKEAKAVVDETLPLGAPNVFVLSVCGFRGGINKIETEGGVNAFAAYTYDDHDTARSLDSKVYDGLDHSSRERYRDRLIYYNKHCSRFDLGYGGVGALLVFPQNTPNVTVPVLWASGNGWQPLFPRVGRIKGIESYVPHFKQVKESRRRESAGDTPRSRFELELITLVEGTSDEAFFDYLFTKVGAAERLRIRSIKPVALGAAIWNVERLIRLARESRNDLVVIADAEKRTERWLRDVTAPMPPIVLLQPSIVELFDRQKVAEVVGPNTEAMKKLTESAEPPPEAFFFAERTLRTRGLGRHPEITRELTDLLLDPARTEAFLTRLGKAISKLIGSDSE